MILHRTGEVKKPRARAGARLKRGLTARFTCTGTGRQIVGRSANAP